MHYFPNRRSTVLYPINHSFVRASIDEENKIIYITNGNYLNKIQTELSFKYDTLDDNIWIAKRANSDNLILIGETDLLNEIDDVVKSRNGKNGEDYFVWLTKLYDTQLGQYFSGDILIDNSSSSVGLWEINGSLILMVTKPFCSFLDRDNERSAFLDYHYFNLDGYSEWVIVGLRFKEKGVVMTPEMQEIFDEWESAAEVLAEYIDSLVETGEDTEDAVQEYEDWLTRNPLECLPNSVYEFSEWFIEPLNEIATDRPTLLVNKKTRQIYSLVDYQYKLLVQDYD